MRPLDYLLIAFIGACIWAVKETDKVIDFCQASWVWAFHLVAPLVA